MLHRRWRGWGSVAKRKTGRNAVGVSLWYSPRASLFYLKIERNNRSLHGTPNRDNASHRRLVRQPDVRPDFTRWISAVAQGQMKPKTCRSPKLRETLNPVLVTMLRAAPHAIHFKRILNSAIRKLTHYALSDFLENSA